MQLVHASGSPSNKSAPTWDGDFFWRDLFKNLFPENTAAYAASFAQTSVGAIDHVLRGRNGVSGRALANLLRSPAGPRVLDGVAGEADWRRIERRVLDIAARERELRELQEQHRSLEALLRQGTK